MDFVLQIIVNSIVLGTQILFLAISLYLIKAVSKIEHVSLGAIGVAIAYTFYLGQTLHIGIWFSIVLSLLAAILLGLASYFLLEKFCKNNQILLALLVSLSFGIGIESIIAILFKSGAKNIIDGVLPIISFAGITMTLPGVYTLVLGVLLAVITYIIVKKTPAGRILRSISENQSLVATLGVNQKRVRKMVYIVASIIAGMVGILLGMNTSLTPTLGFTYIMIAFIALFVGGPSDIRGTIVASYIIILIPEFLINFAPANMQFTSSYRMFFVFVIACIVLSIKPRGIFSKTVRQT